MHSKGSSQVRVVERLRHVRGDPNRLVHRKLVLPIQLLPEALPLDIRHHIEKEGVGLARIEQRQDVRMLQIRRRFDFSEETLGSNDSGQLGLQDFEGDVAFVLQVLGKVDRGHAAFAQFTLNGVAAFEG